MQKAVDLAREFAERARDIGKGSAEYPSAVEDFARELELKIQREGGGRGGKMRDFDFLDIYDSGYAAARGLALTILSNRLWGLREDGASKEVVDEVESFIVTFYRESRNEEEKEADHAD